MPRLGSGNEARARRALDAFVFRFIPGGEPADTLKLKVEINTREHGQPIRHQARFRSRCNSGWFRGEGQYRVIRAGRAIRHQVACLAATPQESRPVRFISRTYSRALAMPRTSSSPASSTTSRSKASPLRAPCRTADAGKTHPSLIEDIEPLLPAGITFQESNALAAFEHIWKRIDRQVQRRAVEGDRSCHP